MKQSANQVFLISLSFVSFLNGFVKEGRSQWSFFLCADCHLFSATTISFIVCKTDFSMYCVTMKNISNLHHGLVVGATSQSCSWWVFCALWPWPFPSHLACLHLSLSGTHHTLSVLISRACFISTLLLKLRKKVTGETWREQVLVHYFHFAMTGGVKQ